MRVLADVIGISAEEFGAPPPEIVFEDALPGILRLDVPPTLAHEGEVYYVIVKVATRAVLPG